MPTLDDILEESEKIGEIKVNSKVMKTINDTMAKLTNQYFYIPSKGVFYAVDLGNIMATIFRSKLFKIPEAKSKVFYIDAPRMKKAMNVTDTDYITMTVLDKALKIKGKNVQSAFKTEMVKQKIKFISKKILLTDKDYIEVPVPSNQLIKGIDWLFGLSTLKHQKGTFQLKDGVLTLYDYGYVGTKKNQTPDEASAIINKTTVVGTFQVKASGNYLKIVGDSLKSVSYADVVYSKITVIPGEDLFSVSNYPLVINGYFDVSKDDKVNKRKITEKYKYEFIIAPMLE